MSDYVRACFADRLGQRFEDAGEARVAWDELGVPLADLTGLLQPEDQGNADVDVLNGIAVDEATGRIFVTGKLWPVLYEIELVAM